MGTERHNCARGVKPVIYLRAELVMLARATAGQSDHEAENTFRRIHWLKKTGGGWIVGTDAAPIKTPQKTPQQSPMVEKLRILTGRVNKALEFFGRDDVGEAEKKGWMPEFEKVLAEIADMT